jgi:predicted HTH domain antitoxin
MQVSIEIPNDFMALENIQEVQQEIQYSYALRLYKHAKVTISRAAELAGLDIYGFMDLCKKEQIPVIDMTANELKQELKNIETL